MEYEYKGITIKTGRGEVNVWLSHEQLFLHSPSGWDGYNFRKTELAKTYIDIALLHAETQVGSFSNGFCYLLMSRTAKQVTDREWQETTGKELPTSFAVQRAIREQQREARRWRRR